MPLPVSLTDELRVAARGGSFAIGSASSSSTVVEASVTGAAHRHRVCAVQAQIEHDLAELRRIAVDDRRWSVVGARR